MTAVAESPAVATGRPAPVRHARRWITLAVAAVVLIAGVEGFWYWRTDLHEFGPGGATVTVPIEVGQTAYVDSGLESPRVDLRVVRPRIVTDSARARVEILVCQGHGIGAVYSAAGDRPDGSICTPWHAGPIRPGTAARQLVYAITPTQAGTVRVAGVHVEYRDGVRTGSEDSGSQAVVRVR